MESHPVALYQSIQTDLCQVEGYESLKSLSSPPPDSSPTLAAAFSLRDSFLKKLRVTNSEKADTACLLNFLTINSRCKDWRCDIPSSKVETLYGLFKENLYRFFDPSCFPDDLLSYMEAGRTGPGVTTSSLCTDLYSKLFSSTLSCKSDLIYDLYKRSNSSQPLWEQAESHRILTHGLPIISDANRLSFVPKYTSISRSICIEPTLNMIFQLGISSYIERRLNSFFGIDIRHQPEKNRILCRKGSRSGLFSTIDLSSASDSISLLMVRDSFPRFMTSILEAARSVQCQIPTYGLCIPLNMLSTMGNGYTFSLQTCIFACVVKAVYSFRGMSVTYPRNEEYGNFAVFGDDIIVETEADRDVRELLEFLGFTINKDKSFSIGPFRESCGVDYYSGVNIRGVYLKTLTSAQDCISLINELNLFSTRTGIRLSCTVSHLMRLIKSKGGKLFYVPLSSPSFAGVRVPLSFWGPKLDRNGSYLYKVYEPKRVGYSVLEGEIKFRRYKPRNIFSVNPFGLELGFLAGAIRDGFCGVRHDNPQFSIKEKVTPCWDDVSVHSSDEWFDWRRFGNATYLNLFG